MIPALLLALALAPTPSRTNEPAELESESLEVLPGARTATARGNVRIRTDGSDVTCDEAEAAYGADKRIEQLRLKGKVHLVRPDGLVADANAASWDAATGRLVLEGSPVVTRGRDVLRGRRMVVGTRDDSLEVDDVRLVSGRDRRHHRTEIRAAKLHLGPGGRLATFEKDVTLSDGTVTARGDRMVAQLVPEAPGRPGEVTSATLTGRVVAKRGTQEARADEANWEAATGLLVLTGKPTLADGDDVVKGARIVFDPSTGGAKVETAVARVKGGP